MCERLPMKLKQCAVVPDAKATLPTADMKVSHEVAMNITLAKHPGKHMASSHLAMGSCLGNSPLLA